MLESVILGGRQLDRVLAESTAYQELPARDRRFLRLLVTETLRRYHSASAILNRQLDRPGKPLQPRPKFVLILAICQLVWIGSPRHAVVSTAVTMMRIVKAPHLAKLANAVLRRVADQAAAEKHNARPQDALPDWLASKLTADWGREETSRLARLLLMPPALDLQLCTTPAAATGDNAHGQQQQRIRQLIMQAEPDAISLAPEQLRLADGDPKTLPGYAEGHFWIQDAGAALAATLFGPIAGKTVIDCCSAPGGKTAQLVMAGAKVTALERDRQRLHRLQQNMERLKLTPTCLCVDASLWQPQHEADAVLADIPCSATGTIRRRPDILCRQKPPELEKLAETQRKILSNSITFLAPGGVLIVVSCSLLKAEGEELAAWLDSDTRLEPAPIEDAEIAPFRRHPGQPPHWLRLMPDSLVLADKPQLEEQQLAADKTASPTELARSETEGDRHVVDAFFIARYKRRQL